MSEYRKACIYVREEFAGILQETDEGYQFTYDDSYLSAETSVAVSLTLPLRKEPYFSNTLFSFFDGLIPEGWLLNVVCHNWKITAHDRFGVLLVACQDAIGCVKVVEVRDEMSVL